MFVCFQYAMRQISVADQFDRAGIFLTEPFLGYIRTGMIVQCLIHASYILDHCQHRSDIMGYQNDRTLFIYLLQQLVKTGFEPFIDIRIRLIQNQELRTGNDRASQ